MRAWVLGQLRGHGKNKTELQARCEQEQTAGGWKRFAFVLKFRVFMVQYVYFNRIFYLEILWLWFMQVTSSAQLFQILCFWNFCYFKSSKYIVLLLFIQKKIKIKRFFFLTLTWRKDAHSYLWTSVFLRPPTRPRAMVFTLGVRIAWDTWKEPWGERSLSVVSKNRMSLRTLVVLAQGAGIFFPGHRKAYCL